MNFHRVYVLLFQEASFPHTSHFAPDFILSARGEDIWNFPHPPLTQHTLSCQSLRKMLCFHICTSLATENSRYSWGFKQKLKNRMGVSQDETSGINSRNMILTWVQNWMSHAVLLVSAAICQQGKKMSICSLGSD